MAGWENLNPDQIVAIIYLMFLCVLAFGSSQIISSFLNYATSKNIKFHMKKEVAKSIAKEIQSPSLFQTIQNRIKKLKEWWKKRRESKNMY